jgi:hypothetical protein
MSEANVKRITVNLRPEDLKRIEALASRSGLTLNEVIRRALATETFVATARDKGETILVDGESGIRQVEFLDR